MGDDVRAPLEWTAKIRCGGRVVDHQGDVEFFRDLRYFLKRENISKRVADGLAENEFCIRLNRASKIFRVGWINQGDLYPQARKGVFELADRPAV